MEWVRDRLGWAPHALSLELRKVLSYRVDFWLQFLGTVFTEVALAYFLWKAVFDLRGVQEIGGFTFQGMMLYYLLVPLVGRVVRGEEFRLLSDDIYEGALTRYLVYPLSFLQYKYVTLLALSILGVVQLLVALGVYAGVVGFPPGVEFGASALIQGLLTCWVAGVLYYFIAASIEMVAFWQDSVWSLMAMLRFTMLLCGGGFLPLTLFPNWIRGALEALPFTYLISFPIRCFMGQVTWMEWARSMGVMALWIAAAALVARWVWTKGTRQYTGVGL